MRVHLFFVSICALSVGVVVAKTITRGEHNQPTDQLALHRPLSGQLAPNIVLPDTRARLHSLASLRGRYVLVSFFCGCIPCRQLTRAWRSLQSDPTAPAILGITA